MRGDDGACAFTGCGGLIVLDWCGVDCEQLGAALRGQIVKRCCVVFAVVWVVVGVVGVYFGGGLLGVNSVPTTTKSAVGLEAEELAIADEVGLGLDYVGHLIGSAEVCGYSTIEMARLVMRVGDEIQKAKPNTEVPRFKVMYLVVNEKPAESDCTIWLTDAVELVEDME